MTEQQCVTEGCARPVHDARVCLSCGDLLTQALGDVPALSGELDVTLSRQTASGARVGGRSSEKPLPYDVGASEAATVLRSTLVAWVRELIGDGEQWPADTLPAMGRWLLASVEDIRQRDDGGVAVDEIVAAVGNARRAIDRRAERVYAGPCQAMVDLSDQFTKAFPEPLRTPCHADLYATLGKDRVKCAECGATYSVEERLEWMRAEMDGMLMTAAECAQYGVAVRLWSNGKADLVRKRINTWSARKLLMPHGINIKGQPTYRFGEAVAMVLEREAA